MRGRCGFAAGAAYPRDPWVGLPRPFQRQNNEDPGMAAVQVLPAASQLHVETYSRGRICSQ